MASAAAHINFLDASALVKLVLNEDRSDKLHSYLKSAPRWYTTPFCFYESLNVLKRKLRTHGISDDQYYRFSFSIMANFRNTPADIYLRDIDLTDPIIFSYTQEICKKHKLDLSDAFQIISIVKGCPFAGDSATLLITNDRKLARAARDENVRVWYLGDDPPA